MKRVLLFIATNLAIMVVFSIVLSVIFSVTGIQSRSMTGLLVMAAVFGMGGSFISLALSKWMAKRHYRIQLIDGQATHATEVWLYNTVKRLAEQSQVGMPEVGIYTAPDMNAFATGMNRNNALVAVSTGLLNNMSQDEAEAVVAHEMSHVSNGDMVTLALIQGIVNTFVIFIARVIAGIISGVLNNDRESSGGSNHFVYFMVSMALEVVFGILASIIVMWFSRHREFRADAGAASLVGANKMKAALQRLKHSYEPSTETALVAFGINGGKSLKSLFASHPPLDARIAALDRGFSNGIHAL